MYYYLNPKSHVMMLQILLMVLLIIIIAMVYHQSTLSDQLDTDIKALDFTCPTCPKIPSCPKNDKCPDCPDCNCENTNVPVSPTSPTSCPACPANNTSCPTVEDIVSGIFPGRTGGVTTGGRYFEINANENYELLPDYDFYQPENAFPQDSILDQPLISGNPPVNMNQINNSLDNLNIDTNIPSSLSGMNMGTGASRRADSNLATESKAPTTAEIDYRPEDATMRGELAAGI